MNDKSEVEKYWDAIAAKAGDPRSFSDLHPVQQQMVINSINLLLRVLSS